MPRLSELAEVTPPAPRDRFVGRERERSEFRNSARYLLEKEAPPGGSPLYPHIFLPHGEGGMGKSALLRQFVRIARDEGLPEAQIIVLDLDSDSYPTIEALAQKLAAAVRRVSPEFDQRYRAARIRRDQLVPQFRELKEQWLRWESLRGTSDVDLDQLLNAHRRTLRHTEIQQARFGTAGLPHMEAQAYESRSELAALLAFRQERGRVPDSLDELLERELGPDDAALFVQTRGLGMALADDLCALADTTPLLLALDTYELADQHDDWLRATILFNSSSRMLTIVAGRNRHDDDYRRTFAGALASLVRSYDLNNQTLQLDEVREYLRLRLNADPVDAIVEEVLQISRGIPLAVEALGDQLADTGDIASYRGLQSEGLDRRGVVHRVTERFLRYALDAKSDGDASRDAKREDRQRIRALSLLLRPDAELACALWCCPHAAAQRIVSQLADRHSFIFAGYAPYELHDLVREFVRANTLAEGRNAFDWPTLDAGLRRALAITEERIARANARIADLDERYVDAEWRDATLDRLNLLLWLGEDQPAMQLLLNRWIEARQANEKFAQELFALADELAPQRKDWRELLAVLREADYKRFVELYRTFLEAHAHFVWIYLRTQQSQVTLVNSDDDLQGINQYIERLEEVIGFEEGWQPVQRTLATAYERRGVYMGQQQDFAGALVDFDQSLALRPDDPATLTNRGWFKSKLGDYLGALADYDQSLALRPDDPITLTNRGWAKSKLGDGLGALADYDQLLALQPDNPITLLLRGWAKSKLGDYLGALADYDKSLALRPENHTTLHYRGWAKGKLGDYLGALADFDHSLALQPDASSTLHYRGVAKGNLSDYPGALSDYDRSLALRPDNPGTLHDRGGVKRNLGDYSGALADYDQSLALRPDDPATLANRGGVKDKLGDYSGALADYDRSLLLRPDDPATLHYGGWVKGKLGDYAGALVDYNRSLELRPDHPNTMYDLACLYAWQNHADTALDWLARAIAKDESNRDLARTDPDFDAIRADPRFAALVGEAGDDEETGR